jgi:PTH1 family peptidyl-tRNA hydrolase
MIRRHVIVGLGNPGSRYSRTRHNLGFMTVDAFTAKHGGRFRRTRFGQVAEMEFGWVLKPQTYMNRSGEAVAPFLRYHRLLPDSLVVVADDLDLPFGVLRIRRTGSSGGHNGLNSIIAALSTNAFGRVRMGISRPPDGMDVIDWVLMPFTKVEEDGLRAVIDRAGTALDTLLKDGLDAAMNRFNG